MKKIFAGILVLLCIISFIGCSTPVSGTVSQEEYEQVVSERDALKKQLEELQKNGEVSTDAIADDQTIADDETQFAGKFDEEIVLSQLKVTEHKFFGKYSTAYFMAVDNNSEFNLEISVSAKFYNAANELIGAKDMSEDAFEKGTSTLISFYLDEEYSYVEYEISVAEEDYYKCVVSDLSYESVAAKDKEILSVTNNGEYAAEFVEVYALFFMGDNVVGCTSNYFTDDDSEIKPGKTITKEMDCYEEYDSVQFFFTGRR